jgi:sugar phosphate isomerase/epimerase
MPPNTIYTTPRAIMLALKIGIQTASLRQQLRQSVQTAASLGADAVEIDARKELLPALQSQTALRQFRKMLDDLNLRVCALAFPTRRGYDNLEDLDRRVAATKETMKMAFSLGASIVVNQVGQIPAPPDAENQNEEHNHWHCLLEVLSELGHFGDHHGAYLAAETGSESGSRLAELLAQVSGASVGATLNPGNLIINGFSPLEAIGALGSSIVYVRARDAVQDAGRGEGIEVALGRGSADFPALLGGLEEHDYRGYITIERRESQDPIFEIGQAVQYLRNL